LWQKNTTGVVRTGELRGVEKVGGAHKYFKLEKWRTRLKKKDSGPKKNGPVRVKKSFGRQKKKN